MTANFFAVDPESLFCFHDTMKKAIMLGMLVMCTGCAGSPFYYPDECVYQTPSKDHR